MTSRDPTDFRIQPDLNVASFRKRKSFSVGFLPKSIGVNERVTGACALFRGTDLSADREFSEGRC